MQGDRTLTDPLAIKTHTESRFYLCLLEWEKETKGDDQHHAQVTHLMGSIDHVVKESIGISKLVVRDMPQYTLHDGAHLLNVLRLMDALVPKGTMAGLTPLECALCIMAAYTHDLGMVLSEEERRQILEPGTEEHAAFQVFRSGYASLVQRVEHLGREAEAEKRAERKAEIKAEIAAIEGYIVSENIRQGHTARHGRTNRWFGRISEGRADVFRCPIYGDFRERLSLIAASHGEDAHWLRREITGTALSGVPLLTNVGRGQKVNWAFPGLLLRLADILDLDWTRTPRLLFENLGLEEWRRTPEAVRGARETSWMEWSKHLATVGWDVDIDDQEPVIQFSAMCWTPVVHRALLDFGEKIDEELAGVQAELDHQKGSVKPARAWRYNLHLPVKADLQVSPRMKEDGNGGFVPAYQYTPIQFALDQHEILQLLMGTSLYGDPSLCIRELLQNALDATQMHELRLKLKQKDRRLPTDALEGEEELEIGLTWGRDEECGQDFVQVTDHGIGMTPEDLRKYFTQVGKSYYRSHEYNRERQAFRDAGEHCSPISIFGIGILSCFMIADRIRVRTRPGGWSNGDTREERTRTDFTIYGPGSLFWMNEGTLDHQGTEVRIYLKPEFTLCHDPETVWEVLCREFSPTMDTLVGSSDYPGGGEVVDPALVAVRYFAWPTHAIRIAPPEHEEILLTEELHAEELAGIDSRWVRESASEWGFPPERLGQGAQWAWWDWVDRGHTGSRIRLWYPAHDGRRSPAFPADAGSKTLLPLSDLASLVEPQLRTSGRFRWLVKGVAVPDAEALTEGIRVLPHVGSRLWIDLRGEATPPLTVDRGKVVPPAEDCRRQMRGVFERFAQEVGREADSVASRRNLLWGWRLHDQLQLPPLPKKGTGGDLLELGRVSRWVAAQLEQSLDRDLDPDRARALDLALDLEFDVALNRGLDRAHDLDGDLDRGLSIALDSYLDRALTPDRALTLAFVLALALPHDLLHDLGRDFVLDLALALDRDLPILLARAPRLRPLAAALCSHLLCEAFQPSLQSSLPTLGCFWMRGHVEDMRLQGPAVLGSDLESHRCAVHASGDTPWLGKQVQSFGYDLVFPITAIPLGRLRAESWTSFKKHRFLRTFVTFPFFAPDVAEEFADQWRVWQPVLNLFPVDRVHVLMPREELWDREFKDWTDEDWETCGISGLWDIKRGWVKWVHGPATADDIAKRGEPLEELMYLGSEERE